MREIKLIEEIKRRSGRAPKGLKSGIGDDCAVLDYDKSRYMLWATDMIVDGTHFSAGKTPYPKIGRKAVAVNISDIAAMGGLPKYITVTLGVPPAMKDGGIMSLYDGIFGICREYGITVVGGDTNRSGRLVIDVSIIGFVEKKKLTLRSGAKVGEKVLITGPVRNGKVSHFDFRPRVKESVIITSRYSPGAMIDVSDGVAMDIGRICSASRVGCVLRADAIPLVKGLSLNDALNYGESFELLFTMSPNNTAKLLKTKKSSGSDGSFYVIGEITSRASGMKLVDLSGNVSKFDMKGYSHL